MTFSILSSGDKYSEIEQELFSRTDLGEGRINEVWDGFVTLYEVPNGTELHMLCKSEFYDASYSYAIYKWNWETEDWDETDSCVTFIYERKSRVKEALEDKIRELLSNRFIRYC